MVRVELAPTIIDQVIAHAAREGVSVDTAIRRMVDAAITKTPTGRNRSKWLRYAKRRRTIAAYVAISSDARDRLEAVAK